MVKPSYSHKHSGGSVLTLLRKSINADIKNIDYTVLVRKPEQAEYYKSEGINAILFENLGQVDLLQKAASEHDVVINTASAFQPKAAAALIAGLAERRKATGGPVHFIHVCFFSPSLKPPGSALLVSFLTDSFIPLYRPLVPLALPTAP